MFKVWQYLYIIIYNSVARPSIYNVPKIYRVPILAVKENGTSSWPDFDLIFRYKSVNYKTNYTELWFTESEDIDSKIIERCKIFKTPKELKYNLIDIYRKTIENNIDTGNIIDNARLENKVREGFGFKKVNEWMDK